MGVNFAGGTGLISRALSPDRAADGDEVVVLDRAPARSRALPREVGAEGWDRGALGRVMGRLSRLSVRALAVRPTFGKVAGLLVTGRRAVPRRPLELGFHFRFAELERAL